MSNYRGGISPRFSACAPKVVEEITIILGAGENGECLSGQTGLETFSPQLIKSNMKGKCKPVMPEDWPQVVINVFEIMIKNYWDPCATLIIVLPSETKKDLDLTIDVLEELKQFKSLIVPLFLILMGGLKDKTESVTSDKITPKQAELFKCWEHNINWGRLFFRNIF